MPAEATSDAVAAESDAGAAGNLASSNQRDQNSVSGRVADFDKDTGADERIETFGATTTEEATRNLSRTTSQGQSFDLTTMVSERSHQASLHAIEIEAARQKLHHQAKLDSQEVKHADDSHTVRTLALMGFTADTVMEAIADNVAKKVIDNLNVKAPGGA